MKRLGIVVSHPIQYYSPLFRYLAQTIDLVVFYCHKPNEEEIGASGFGKQFSWDTDLMSGYSFVFLENVSKKPSLNNFKGCDCPQIGKALEEKRITHVVILGWYLKAYIQALLQARKLNLKVAVRGDSQLNPEEPIYKSMLKKLLYPLLLSRYDKLLYVGQRNREYLLANGAKPSQLIFSPHAVDQTFWKKDGDIAEQKQNGKMVFVWIGKFIEKKRPEDAIKAFTEASALNPDLELWMIGSGNLLEHCRELSKAHTSVFFKGFKNQKELKEELKNAHALILTSDYRETWGLVVNEGFAMGLPAIVSNSSGCSADLIEEGKTGYLYNVKNTKELRDKIINLAHMLYADARFFDSGISAKNETYSYTRNLISFEEFLNS